MIDYPKATPAKGANYVVSVPNTAATITLPMARGQHVISMLVWSYSGDPTGGRLTITGAGFDFDVDITTGGPGYIPWVTPEKATSREEAIVITLSAGGAGIVGKLNLLGHRIE